MVLGEKDNRQRGLRGNGMTWPFDFSFADLKNESQQIALPTLPGTIQTIARKRRVCRRLDEL